MYIDNSGRQISTGYNMGLSKVAVQSFTETFLITESLVLRMNIYAEKPAHRNSAKR